MTPPVVVKAEATDLEKGKTGTITDHQPEKRPYAPPRKPVRSARSQRVEMQSIDTRSGEKPRSWLEQVDMKQKFNRGDVENLRYLGTLLANCEMDAKLSKNCIVSLNKVRQRLHQMEFFDFLSPVVIKKSRILAESFGLPRIFKDSQSLLYPWDIQADARALYNRLMQGILDPHLLRGIDSTRRKRGDGKSTVAHTLQKDCLFRIPCNVVGENGLVNGQWWPLQICAMRDGAHGEMEAGIHGQPNNGAFSVVLSSGGYDDRDEGDRILYCGTSGSEGKATAGTRYLLDTYRTGNPVRVLRSGALPASNPWAPPKGLRYDGLYEILAYEILDVATAMHRFTLRRRAGQDPIRFKGVEARPSVEESAEISKIRGLLGLSS
ncbi:MAG: hypothetical protein M1817_000345 [Caeruleum heppii]|nr:MAG: hypothetical protein M1817_000345 [Caeruleum heppii]